MKTRFGLTILVIIGSLLLAGCSGMPPVQDVTSQNEVEPSNYKYLHNRDGTEPWYEGSWD